MTITLNMARQIIHANIRDEVNKWAVEKLAERGFQKYGSQNDGISSSSRVF